jgi:Lipase (class 3)
MGVQVAVHATTFASPKVGNAAFARSFGSAINTGYWNLFTYGDIVHHAPRSWMSLLVRQGPYKHAENKVRIDEAGTLDLVQGIDFSGVQVDLSEVRGIPS